MELGLYYGIDFSTPSLYSTIEVLHLNRDGTIDTSEHNRHMTVNSFLHNHFKTPEEAEKEAIRRFCINSHSFKNLYKFDFEHIISIAVEKYPDMVIKNIECLQ